MSTVRNYLRRTGLEVSTEVEGRARYIHDPTSKTEFPFNEVEWTVNLFEPESKPVRCIIEFDGTPQGVAEVIRRVFEDPGSTISEKGKPGGIRDKPGRPPKPPQSGGPQ